ncbi:unnamed protein product [Paramecium primaurelia]|uniref:Uncharacterized protein n=1 Tax=Paramecium primaurelia TaxID=5886 RepID=A0A8S1PK94_PARPR|nr:unnamed protein product [Paramecium primaurelia]CAD8103196.1 unnamed protein product [Paramecium primaurelia]
MNKYLVQTHSMNETKIETKLNLFNCNISSFKQYLIYNKSTLSTHNLLETDERRTNIYTTMRTKILQDLEAQQQEFTNNSIHKKQLIIIILRIINHTTIQQLIQQIKLQSWLQLMYTSTVDRNLKIIIKSLKKQQFKSWNKQDTQQLYQYVEISIIINPYSIPQQFNTKQNNILKKKFKLPYSLIN